MTNTSSPPVPFSRLVAYLRKSRADGEESVEEVLAKHERILQDYVTNTWGVPLPDSKIFREVHSGETIAARPVMQQLIGMVQRKEVDGVLVVELQRLSRGDLLDVGTLSQLFLYTGCKILTPTRTWNLSDEFDKRFFEMELMHGKDYLEYTKKIMSRGREQSAREGNYIGSRPPYGYRRVFVDKRPTLSVVPVEAEVVRLIFELYAGSERLGPHLISDRLNEMGLPSQRMDHWTPSAVRNVIENPVYIGKIRWNRRKSVKEFRDGRIVTTQPVSDDYLLVDGKHEPIISEELWNRAAAAAKTRAHPSARHDRSTIVNPLSGLLCCVNCGRIMSYKLCYDHKTKKPLPPIYLCTTRGCSTRGGTYADIMKSLGDLLNNAAAKLDVTEEEGRPAFDPSEHSREIYKSQLDELQKQQERLYDFLERGIYDEETFLTRNRALREKIGSAEARLAELNENEKTAEEKERFRSTIQACIDALADPSSTAESLNKVLKQLLRRIDYQRERTTRFRCDSVPINLSLVFM